MEKFLEKIVTDWYTLYSTVSRITELKNCVIYISEDNLKKLKEKINEIANNNSLDKASKLYELNRYKAYIDYVRKFDKDIREDVLQTDELEFIKENNSYMVIVKETKDIRTFNEDLSDRDIVKEENDTIFIALAEEAQILTIKDSICNLVKEYEIPVFCLNIKQTD